MTQQACDCVIFSPQNTLQLPPIKPPHTLPKIKPCMLFKYSKGKGFVAKKTEMIKLTIYGDVYWQINLCETTHEPGS